MSAYDDRKGAHYIYLVKTPVLMTYSIRDLSMESVLVQYEIP